MKPPMGFGGGGGMGNMGKLLKQAQKMQADIAKAQEDVLTFEADGSAGGGAVTAKVNGKYELIELKISPDAIDPADPGMLEDLVSAAVNMAIRDVREKSEAHLAKATSGMAGMMPPGLGF